MELLVVILVATLGVGAALYPLLTRSRRNAPPADLGTDAGVAARVRDYRAALRAGTYCVRCGTANPSASRYCGECGARLTAALE
ncbi:MAG: zinc-ribbon domain-containing protein [Longimicrobiales bacterium]